MSPRRRAGYYPLHYQMPMKDRMKTTPQHTRQAMSAPSMSPSRAARAFPVLRFLRYAAKRLTVWAYCHEYLSLEATRRIFELFDIRGA